jgi:hypothetical protein
MALLKKPFWSKNQLMYLNMSIKDMSFGKSKLCCTGQKWVLYKMVWFTVYDRILREWIFMIKHQDKAENCQKSDIS